MLSNAIRGHMAELGVISAKGRNGTAELLKIIANKTNDCIPAAAQFSLDVLARQYAATTAEIGKLITASSACAYEDSPAHATSSISPPSFRTSRTLAYHV